MWGWRTCPSIWLNVRTCNVPQMPCESTWLMLHTRSIEILTTFFGPDGELTRFVSKSLADGTLHPRVAERVRAVALISLQSSEVSNHTVRFIDRFCIFDALDDFACEFFVLRAEHCAVLTSHVCGRVRLVSSQKVSRTSLTAAFGEGGVCLLPKALSCEDKLKLLQECGWLASIWQRRFILGGRDDLQHWTCAVRVIGGDREAWDLFFAVGQLQTSHPACCKWCGSSRRCVASLA